MKHFLIHDANNACWRLIKRLPILTANGKQIQVVYGFLRLLRSSIEQFNPSHVLVCWDSGRSAFRKKMYPDYKGNRNHNSDKAHEKEHNNFMHQASAIKSLLTHLNVAQLDYPDSEADDLIAIACASLQGKKTIVSTDRDMLQLVSDNVQVWRPAAADPELYTKENFYEKTKLSTSQYLQLRALVGDGTDNIKSVAKGFGETTAMELLKQYGSIQNLFKPKIEKEVFKRGNRYALLYGDGARKIAYRNLLLMDLKLAGAQNPNHDKIVKLLHETVVKRSKVNRVECLSYFTQQKFDSLKKDFSLWIAPFEELDND